MKRSCGVLLHISSLPCAHGIGTFGREAYAFVDFLREAGQTYWQMLPVGPVGAGDSPYQTFSTFAGNPHFIDLDLLREDGLLEQSEIDALDWGDDTSAVDYEAVAANRPAVLRAAFNRGFAREREAFCAFAAEQADWLDDYALFMALKDHFEGASWHEWPSKKLRLRESETLAQYAAQLQKDVDFYRYVQFLFFRQWDALRQYAHRQGVKLIGDLPIYVSMDGADTWANSPLFRFDQDRSPECVAGCPPDYFSPTGQLWGNPLYDWDAHRRTGYDWWVRRMRAVSAQFDVVRLDHFRGFEAYYDIPFGDATAEHGVWRKGPGSELFSTLRKRLGKLSVIAEDLGYLTPAVRALLRETRFPGMKVLQFAFDSPGSDYLPHAHIRNCVVYTGTHDNDTTEGFFAHADPAVADYAKVYLRLSAEEGYAWGMIRGAYASVATLAVAPMQDFLALGSEARMNTPSTPRGNWRWRMQKGCLRGDLAQRMRHLAELYGRTGNGD